MEQLYQTCGSLRDCVQRARQISDGRNAVRFLSPSFHRLPAASHVSPSCRSCGLPWLNLTASSPFPRLWRSCRPALSNQRLIFSKSIRGTCPASSVGTVGTNMVGGGGQSLTRRPRFVPKHLSSNSWIPWVPQVDLSRRASSDLCVQPLPTRVMSRRAPRPGHQPLDPRHGGRRGLRACGH